MKAFLLCLTFVLFLSPAFSRVPLQDNQDNQPQAKADANATIQSNIKSVLEGDPILSGTDVEAAVDDRNITLTGTVESYAQHQRVLQLVEPYARYRKVVDNIKTSGSSSQTR